jgi:hypothetical protein
MWGGTAPYGRGAVSLYKEPAVVQPKRNVNMK